LPQEYGVVNHRTLKSFSKINNILFRDLSLFVNFIFIINKVDGRFEALEIAIILK